jgi:hypothetical protein
MPAGAGHRRKCRVEELRHGQLRSSVSRDARPVKWCFEEIGCPKIAGVPDIPVLAVMSARRQSARAARRAEAPQAAHLSKEIRHAAESFASLFPGKRAWKRREKFPSALGRL